MRYTNSELSTWRDCRRQWYLGYYLSLGPRNEHLNEAKEMGNLFHEAVAWGYANAWQSDPLADVALLAFALEEKHGECEKCEPKLKKIREYSELMVVGYIQWLEETGADSDLLLLSVEEAIEVDPDWGEGITLLAKMDARFMRERDGFRFFMDHKSVQNLTDRPKWAHIDTQFKFYAILDRLRKDAEAAHTDGGVINMARRVKRSATAKPPFYGRHEVRHSDEELRAFWYSVHETIMDIERARKRLDAGETAHMYPSPSQDCTWKCKFFNVCPMIDRGEDVEGYIEAAYIEINPLARYEDATPLAAKSDAEIKDMMETL